MTLYPAAHHRFCRILRRVARLTQPREVVELRNPVVLFGPVSIGRDLPERAAVIHSGVH
jgi:hypothetical protein